MRFWLALLVLAAGVEAVAAEPGVAGGAQSASGRMVVVGLGRCDEPLLAEGTRSLRREIGALGGTAVLDEEATAAPAGGLAHSSADEVRRLIEQGREDFLGLHVERALRTLRQAVADADRLPIGPERTEAYWSARVHLARVHQYREERTRASELFVDILRVRENFTISRLEFPPSTRELLEMSRALVAALPRFRLKVATPQPGATVYLNGFAVGRTPYEGALPAGSYSLVVGTPERHSFVRPITLAADVALQLDPDEEGRLRANRGPCWELAGERDARLKAAARLGSAVGAEAAIAVRLERLGTDEYIAAALVDLTRGSEVREGRLRLDGGRLPDVARLARFLLTGEGLDERPPAPAEAVAATAPTAQPEAANVAVRAPIDWSRVGAWALTGAAAVLAGMAVYEQANLQSLARQRSTLTVIGSGGALRAEDVPRAQQLTRRIDASATRRTAFAAAAGVSVGASGLLFLWTQAGGAGATKAMEAQIAISHRF